jgi:hypothetical protein
MNTHKLVKILALIIGVIGLVVYFATFAYKPEELQTNSLVGIFITLSYIAMAIAIATVLYFVVKNLLMHKDQLKKAMITLGLFFGVILVAFIMADGTEVKLKDGGLISATYSKIISTGLNTFYILALASIVVLAWTGFSKIKK